MYQRVGKIAFKKDLTNTLVLLESVGNPHNNLACVHIAGTNGKGSTSHLLASILQEAGYHVGLYTSPHLKDYRERIRMNGEMILEQDVIHFLNLIEKQVKKIKPSFFEITVAMSFWYFSKKNVDIAVIETGLGGRLDSTNVITPLLSVITNIGFDHMNMLGETLEKIAFEKAGIIKPGIPVVIGERQTEIEHVFQLKAERSKSAPVYANQIVDVMDRDVYLNASLGQDDIAFIQGHLMGDHQLRNMKTALASIYVLVHKLNLKVSTVAIKNGIQSVKTNTGFRGRWEILNTQPLTIADVGHNQDGIRQIVEMIKKQTFNQLHFVFGTVRDKELSKILNQLPTDAIYYFCCPNVPRGLSEIQLAELAKPLNLNGKTYGSVKLALKSAQQNATNEDMIFIGGSTFVVAEVL